MYLFINKLHRIIGLMNDIFFFDVNENHQNIGNLDQQNVHDILNEKIDYSFY